MSLAYWDVVRPTWRKEPGKGAESLCSGRYVKFQRSQSTKPTIQFNQNKLPLTLKEKQNVFFLG
jgi:paraquat-inducible protein B